MASTDAIPRSVVPACNLFGRRVSQRGCVGRYDCEGCGHRDDGGGHEGGITFGYIASPQQTNIIGAAAPPGYSTAPDLAVRERARQAAHGKYAAYLQRPFDEQREAMADAQRQHDVWVSTRPERATAPWVIPQKQYAHVYKIGWLDESDTRGLESEFLARCNRQTWLSSAASQLAVAAPRLAAAVRRSI